MVGVDGAVGGCFGEGDVARRGGGDGETVVGLQAGHVDVIDGWVGETDGHHVAVVFFPCAEAFDLLLVAIYLRDTEHLTLELEEVIALDVDGRAGSGDLLDVPGAEPRADVAVVAGAGGHQQQSDERYDI